MTDVAPPGDYYVAFNQLLNDLLTCLYTMQLDMAYQTPTTGPGDVLNAINLVKSDYNALEQWLEQTLRRSLQAGNNVFPTAVQTEQAAMATDMVSKGTPAT
jgi:hypothetical protein